MARYSEKYWDDELPGTALIGAEIRYGCEITDNETGIVGTTHNWKSSKTVAHDAAWEDLMEKQHGYDEDQKERQRNELREYVPKPRIEGDETGLITLLVKWAVYIGLFFGAVWLAFAVALPLIIINCALICLVVGVVNRNTKTYMFLLSAIGAIFILIDYNEGWFTKTLVNNVSFFAGAIPFFLYLNISTGLIASYFLIRDLINKNFPTKEEGEFSKRNLITMASLLVIGGTTVVLQRHFDSQSRIQATNMVYSNNVTNSPNQNNAAGKMDSAKMGNGTLTTYAGMYPQSSMRLLTPGEVSTLNKYDLKIMRNEIFARHGYIFRTAEMKKYFEQQNWYKPVYNDVTNQLTNIENTNVELIKSYER